MALPVVRRIHVITRISPVILKATISVCDSAKSSTALHALSSASSSFVLMLLSQHLGAQAAKHGGWVPDPLHITELSIFPVHHFSRLRRYIPQNREEESSTCHLAP